MKRTRQGTSTLKQSGKRTRRTPTGGRSLSRYETLFGPGLLKRKHFFQEWNRHFGCAESHETTRNVLVHRVFARGLVYLTLVVKLLKTETELHRLKKLQQKRLSWDKILEKLSSVDEIPTDFHITLVAYVLKATSQRFSGLKPFWTDTYTHVTNILSRPVSVTQERSEHYSEPRTSVYTKTVSPVRPSEIEASLHLGRFEDKQKQDPLTVTRSIRIYPSSSQRKVLDMFVRTSSHLYNKTIHALTVERFPCDFQHLRDHLVTQKSKKDNPEYMRLSELKVTLKQQLSVSFPTSPLRDWLTETLEAAKRDFSMLEASVNPTVKEWEVKTPKEIRAGAVKDAVTAFTTNVKLVREGKKKFFCMKKRDKRSEGTQDASVVVPPSMVSVSDGQLLLLPNMYKNKLRIPFGKRNRRKFNVLRITKTVRVLKKGGRWFVQVPFEKNVPQNQPEGRRVCGIDPGVRDFLTCWSQENIVEFQHDQERIKRLDQRQQAMKNHTGRKPLRGNAAFRKIERRKAHLVDELHWKVAAELVDMYDVIFIGDIKTSDIVRGGKNRTLNRDLNNLKFYKFKSRLLHKAASSTARVFYISEEYTTKTCSFCGKLNDPGSSKVYHCTGNRSCGAVVGRDHNAAKNIAMKGFLTTKF